MQTSIAYKIYCFLYKTPDMAGTLTSKVLALQTKVNKRFDAFMWKAFIFMVWISFILMLVLLALSVSDASAAPTANSVADIATVFQQKAKAWEPVLRRYALTIFRYLLIIDVAWLGIRMALKHANIQETIVEFIRLVVFASVMLVVIFYYKTWTNTLFQFLSFIGETELNAPQVEAGAILSVGFNVFKGAVANIGKVGITQIPIAILGSFCAIGICIIFAMIAAQALLIKCEAYIVLNAGAITLGLGGSQLTKSYATNFLRYSLAVAMKLFVLQLLVALGMDFITDFQNADPSLESLAVLIACGIVLLALVNSIPNIMSGIIQGTAVSNSQAITAAVTAASTATIAAMTALKNSGVGGKNAVDAVKEASKFANQAGMSGVGKAKHMGGSLMGAAKASKAPTFGKNVASNLKAQREAFNMEKEADNGKE
ncbi:MAG: P-type conjugative transfer protein TrbL [Pseudodesulfovibrio sp.]|nr:P-type conjugative transfer protein TrbL [Pseudodesulfovibrio sp.]